MEENFSPTRIRSILRDGGVPHVTPELFVQLSSADQASLLERLPMDRAWPLLRDSDSASIVAGLERFGFDRAAPLLREIPPDDLADLALRLAPESREKMLAAVGPELAAEVKPLLEYTTGTAGGLMSTRCASVPEVVTVARALELIRDLAKAETVNYIYVVDANGKLVGTLPVRALLAASPRQHVSEIASRAIVKLPVRAAREEVVWTFHAHHYLALPVVDDHDRLVGVITADDVLLAAQDQENQLVFSATGADAREPLMETARAARTRIPWVTVTVLGGLGCAFVAGLFKATLERVVVLGLFIPLVLAVAESVATQTTTLVMKALVEGSLSRRALASFMAKEVMIGLLVGAYAAALVGGISMFWHLRWRLAVVIGTSVALSVCWSTLLGVAVPALLRRLRIEPSVATGPLVLTLADLSTLAIYFGTAALLM